MRYALLRRSPRRASARICGIGALRLPENIAPDVVTVRLHEIMRRLGPELGWTVPFVMLLLAPSGTRLPALSEMSAEQIKDRTLAALLALVAALAKSRPILVVVEDAHWIDPTSQALLDQLVDQAREIYPDSVTSRK